VNERFKELFIQVRNESENMRWNIEDAETFAELIVQESCYKLMEMHEKVNGDHNYYHHASVQLKQHFGSRVSDEPS